MLLWAQQIKPRKIYTGSQKSKGQSLRLHKRQLQSLESMRFNRQKRHTKNKKGESWNQKLN